MNRKNLRPNLAAPVDRSATTKFVSTLTQDANGITSSEWWRPTAADCEWCVKDCKKYNPRNAFSCVQHTCHGDCQAYFDQF